MAKPKEEVFYNVAEQSYVVNPAKTLDGFVLLRDSPTMDAYINQKDRVIMLGVRGTKLTDKADLQADAALPFGRLVDTPRYKTDKQFVMTLRRQYPFYSIYLAGHSLGGAIINQLKRDSPYLKDAVEYNPAFQPRDLTQQGSGIKRLYVSTDPLYKLGGRLFRGAQIVPGYAGILSGHGLKNFARLYSLQSFQPQLGYSETFDFPE